MSERVICVVYTQSQPGEEPDYHDWYDNQHLGDVARISGVVSAQRYDLLDVGSAGSGPPASCLAVYEIEGDPRTFVEELRSKFGTEAMPASPALDLGSLSMSFWKPRGGRITA